MPQKHTIAVSPDGLLEFTRNTKLSAVLAPLGKTVMERVTDIKQHETGNFYIHWLLGKFAGQGHTYNNFIEYSDYFKISEKCLDALYSSMVGLEYEVMLFDTYENAVAHEIDMLAAMRRAGETFAQEAKQTRTEHAANADQEKQSDTDCPLCEAGYPVIYS
jgi:hypothetical protein